MEPKILIDSLRTGRSLIETHISWILLEKDYAYKIKKPVKFWFLDFSTLEKRRFDCEEEIRLNRRFSPDIYLGTVPITKNAHGIVEFGGDGTPLEYAVKMVRLPDDRRMDILLKENLVAPGIIEDIAARIYEFHGTAPVINIEAYDYAGMLRHVCLSDLGQLLENLDNQAQTKVVTGVRARFENFFNRHAADLRNRQLSGKVRECHGDLHSKNIFITDRPVIIDCIEFNKEMRYMDTLWEISYMAMDLERWGALDLSRIFIEKYLNLSGEKGVGHLLTFHKAQMAMVLAKVAAVKLAQGVEKDPRDLGIYLEMARKYSEKISLE